jgi:hypothetical protein
MNDNGTQWYQLIINDPNFLSGSSVLEFIAPLVKLFRINYVLVKDVVGAVPDRSSLDGTLLSAEDFMKRIPLATQYDWAFFFMYEENPFVTDMTWGQTDNRILIEKARLTIRLADSSQFFLYEKTGEVLKALKGNPNISESKVVKLNELDIPY